MNYRLTEKSKQKTLIFDSESHHFVINNASARIVFKLFHHREKKLELVYERTVKVLDMWRE
jgi:hypothetical protein